MHDAQDDRTRSRNDRRRVLYRIGGGAVFAAMGGRATRAAGATSAAWEQTVAAARKEGKVAINTFTGQGYGRVLELFARAYPDIEVDHTKGRACCRSWTTRPPAAWSGSSTARRIPTRRRS